LRVLRREYISAAQLHNFNDPRRSIRSGIWRCVYRNRGSWSRFG